MDMTINDFLTDRLVIAFYPPWSGGKFLINALGLSDSCVFQNAYWARQQLDGGFNLKRKIRYLHDNLNLAQRDCEWRDLGLGCQEYFDIPNDLYFDIDVRDQEFNPIVKDTIDQNKCFFIVAHDTNFLSAYLHIWPNARIIYFDNYTDFIKSRKTRTSRIYPMLVKNFMAAVPNEKKFVWDTTWYNSTEDTVKNIELCYNWLKLDPIDFAHVANYHQRWIEVITYIQQNSQTT
jgi:hypothetical protein